MFKVEPAGVTIANEKVTVKKATASSPKESATAGKARARLEANGSATAAGMMRLVRAEQPPGLRHQGLVITPARDRCIAVDGTTTTHFRNGKLKPRQCAFSYIFT